MIQENPIVSQYIAALKADLGGLNETDRAEVVRDIESHISEAVAAGQPLDRVLGSLGSAGSLARAYTVELLIKKPSAFKAPGNRALRIAGLVLVGGVPTIVAFAVFGLVGVTFSFTGVVLFLAGKAALAEALPWWLTMDADPRLVVILGPVMSMVGLALLGGLWLYVRMATNVVRRVLPPSNG
jgi:uncharacterized membrane protein